MELISFFIFSHTFFFIGCIIMLPLPFAFIAVVKKLGENTTMSDQIRLVLFFYITPFLYGCLLYTGHYMNIN